MLQHAARLSAVNVQVWDRRVLRDAPHVLSPQWRAAKRTGRAQFRIDALRRRFPPFIIPELASLGLLSLVAWRMKMPRSNGAFAQDRALLRLAVSVGRRDANVMMLRLTQLRHRPVFCVAVAKPLSKYSFEPIRLPRRLALKFRSHSCCAPTR